MRHCRGELGADIHHQDLDWNPTRWDALAWIIGFLVTMVILYPIYGLYGYPFGILGSMIFYSMKASLWPVAMLGLLVLSMALLNHQLDLNHRYESCVNKCKQHRLFLEMGGDGFWNCSNNNPEKPQNYLAIYQFGECQVFQPNGYQQLPIVTNEANK